MMLHKNIRVGSGFIFSTVCFIGVAGWYQERKLRKLDHEVRMKLIERCK